MKRNLLSILLILSFVFAACPVLAVQTTVETDNETFLNQLIAMPGGITSETTNITRGKYAEALAAFMGADISAMPQNITSKFYDVYGVNAQNVAIVYLEQNNVITGDENGMFNPERIITVGEAVKMLVTAMGYDGMAQYYGGYPEGYMQMASEISLLKSVTYNYNDTLNGKQLINMFYNALHSKIMKVSMFEGEEVVLDREDTFLTGILEMGVSRGIVDATEYTGLYSNETASDDCIKIDGIEYVLSEKTREIIDYLGYRVDAYYKLVDGERVLYGYEFVKNEVLKIDAKEIESVEDYVLTYTVNDRSKKIKLQRNISVIYNGEYTDVYTNEMLKPDMGSITLIANSSSDNYDVIIVEDYKNYVISGVDQYEMVIYDRLDSDRKIELEKNDLNYVLIDNNGVEISLSDLSVNSVLSVAMSAGGRYAKMIATLNIVEGAFVSENTDDDERSFVIGSKTYPVSKDFKQSTPTSGFGGKFFLDFNGNVVFYLSSVISDEWNVGYVIKIYPDEGLEGYGTKILQSDNLIVDYKFAEKVRVNNISYNETDLKNASGLYYNEEFPRQLIRYKTNADNEISRVQTATDDLTSPLERLDNTNVFSEGTRMRYRSSIQCFNYKVYVTNQTKVFVVPEKSKMFDTAGSFRMEKIGYLVDNRDYTVQAFAVGDNMSEATAIVLTQSRDQIPSSLSDWANLFVVKDKNIVLDNDDEIMTEFVLVNKGTENTLRITQNALDNVYFGSETGPFDIDVGDAVRYSTNADNEINYMQLIYDADTGEYRKAISSYINTSFTADTSMYFGMAYNRPNDIGSRVRVNIGTEDKPDLHILPIEKFSATLVDLSQATPVVTALQSAAQIRTSDVFGTEKASKVVYMAHQGVPASMVVYVE